MNGKWHTIEFKEYLPVRGELSAIGKLVLRGTRIVIPKQLRAQVLKLAHYDHPGIVAMKQRLRTKVWWPGIKKEVDRACKTYHGCQLVSQPSKPEPMTRTELPSAPWQHLAADFIEMRLPCCLVLCILFKMYFIFLNLFTGCTLFVIG